MSLKVGDTIWCNRDYGRHRWISTTIDGETKQSWLLGDPRFAQRRVNKKTLIESNGQYAAYHWFTEQGMKDCIWISKNVHNIAGVVQTSKDIEKLRQIAAIIGYTTDEDLPT